MSKLQKLILVITLFVTILNLPLIVPTAKADNIFTSAPDCRKLGISYTTDPIPIPEDTTKTIMTFTGIPNGRYQMRSYDPRTGSEVYEADTPDPVPPDPTTPGATSPDPTQTYKQRDAYGGILTIVITSSFNKLAYGVHQATLQVWTSAPTPTNPTNGSWNDFCGFIQYQVGYTTDQCLITVSPQDPRTNEPFQVFISDAPKGIYPLVLQTEDIKTGLLNAIGIANLTDPKYLLDNITVDASGNGVSKEISPQTPQKGQLVLATATSSKLLLFCNQNINITPGFGLPRPIVTPTPGPLLGVGGDSINAAGVGCTPLGESGTNGLATAIGCIPTDPINLLKALLTFGVAISGGIAFLLMLFGAFQMITSQGSPEALQAGKDRLTSATIGLLFIIFAVLLLQIIGNDILNIFK